MNLVGDSEDWGTLHVTRMEDAWRQVKSKEIRMDMRMHLGETVQGLAESARDLVFCPVSKGDRCWQSEDSDGRGIGGLEWTECGHQKTR